MACNEYRFMNRIKFRLEKYTNLIFKPLNKSLQELLINSALDEMTYGTIHEAS